MKKSILISSKILLLATTLFAMSCDKIPDNPKDIQGSYYFNVAYSTSTEGNTETYVQALTDLSTGSITFEKYGFEVPSTRMARIYASADGKKLYNLNYGGGTVSKFDVLGGQNYTQLSDMNVAFAIGTEYPRWTKISDNNALLQNVTTLNKYENETKYLYTEATAWLVNVNLDGEMSMGIKEKVIFPRSSEDEIKNLNVWRMDAPVISNGKIYYGVAKRTYNPSTDQINNNILYQASSLVLDYPSLKNPKMISSALTTGSTYGYRIPVSYNDENNDVYQLTDNPSHILKITDGEYDNNYVFNLSEALGFSVGAKGWFYTGDGVGYVIFYDVDKGISEDVAAWGVARVDIRHQTAVKMNLPDKLYLHQYQYSKRGLDGKLYMALAPVGQDGNIYIFDPARADAEGFETGAKLTTGAGAYYIGVF